MAFLVPFEPFTLSAKVSINGERTTFDAGALSIWSDEDHWAKLCFESSPDGDTMVVSVVTNTYSDDVNSRLVAGVSIYLRLAFLGKNAWAFHSSTDGDRRNIVRVCNIPVSDTRPTYVGFLSQAPIGNRCEAVIGDIQISRTLLSDARNGS